MPKVTDNFDASLKTMIRKLSSGRNGIQTHLENVGRLAAEHNNLEGYVQKTINALDEYGQQTYAKAAILWIEKFYGYTCDDNGKQVEWKGADFVRANFSAARECKFWTMAKKTNSFKGFNFNDAVHAVLAQSDKMLKSVESGKINEEDAKSVVIDLDAVRRVRAALTAAA